MNLPVEKLIIGHTVPLREALVRINENALNFLIVVDDQGRLFGVMTDGDIRRSILEEVTLDHAVGLVAKRDCVSLPVSAGSDEIGKVLSERIAWIPLLDEEGRPVDYTGLARRRHYPVMEPFLSGREEDYVLECIRTGWISSQGRFVAQFEGMMADYHGVEHALAVCNGTIALHLALVTLGVGPGDEVIVPDFTFAATAAAVVHTGARPVLADVTLEDWTLDVDAFKAAIGPNTKAVIPVHLYGHPCRMDRIMEIARANNLKVIEDCAEALGSEQGGRLVGTFGDAACYSFFGNKVLTTGEGGMILFSNQRDYERARMLRDHGMDPGRRYWHLEPGFNYRMTNLQAAVGVAQLERAEEILFRKEALAQEYDRALSDLPGILPPPRRDWARPVCWLYTIRLSEEVAGVRDEIITDLLSNGIETRPTFYPIHRMPAFSGFSGHGNYPNSDTLSNQGLSLPSAVTLSPEDVVRVVQGLRDSIRFRKVFNTIKPKLKSGKNSGRTPAVS